MTVRQTRSVRLTGSNWIREANPERNIARLQKPSPLSRCQVVLTKNLLLQIILLSTNNIVNFLAHNFFVTNFVGVVAKQEDAVPDWHPRE